MRKTSCACAILIPARMSFIGSVIIREGTAVGITVTAGIIDGRITVGRSEGEVIGNIMGSGKLVGKRTVGENGAIN
jgi:hypothetical protein